MMENGEMLSDDCRLLIDCAIDNFQ